MRKEIFIPCRFARFGDIFVSEQLAVVASDEAYVGIFVCSHNLDVREKALFRNVRIEIPAADTMVVYRDFWEAISRR